MPERSFSSPSYRYGFNGMEKDDEVKGSSGTSYDFGARLYDSRLGRWMSIDPLASKYPELTPYHFTANNPVLYVDYDGKDYGIAVDHNNQTIVLKLDVYVAYDERPLPYGTYNTSDTYEKIKRAEQFYENISADFQTTDDNGNTISYLVTFEVEVHKANNRVDAMNKASANNEGNSVLAGPQCRPTRGLTNADRTGPQRNVNGVMVNREGFNQNGQFIFIDGGVNKDVVGVHEIGHSLVTLSQPFHAQGGTFMGSMGAGEGPDVPNGFLQNMLFNGGIGVNSSAIFNVNVNVTTQGTEPQSFSTGVITDICNSNTECEPIVYPSGDCDE